MYDIKLYLTYTATCTMYPLSRSKPTKLQLSLSERCWYTLRISDYRNWVHTNNTMKWYMNKLYMLHASQLTLIASDGLHVALVGVQSLEVDGPVLLWWCNSLSILSSYSTTVLRRATILFWAHLTFSTNSTTKETPITPTTTCVCYTLNLFMVFICVHFTLGARSFDQFWDD